MAGYGLDDSDIDEFLASSSDDEVVVIIPTAGSVASLVPARSRSAMLTCTVCRGSKQSMAGDASRLTPANR